MDLRGSTTAGVYSSSRKSQLDNEIPPSPIGSMLRNTNARRLYLVDNGLISVISRGNQDEDQWKCECSWINQSNRQIIWHLTKYDEKADDTRSRTKQDFEKALITIGKIDKRSMMRYGDRCPSYQFY